MKKKLGGIRLHRETVRYLSAAALASVGGGAIGKSWGSICDTLDMTKSNVVTCLWQCHSVEGAGCGGTIGCG